MSELSTADRETIEKFRLKKSLGHLHDRLKAANQASRNPTPDTANHSKKAVLRLLSVLHVQEAAAELQSKTSGENVAFDLASLFKILQQSRFNYDHYQPLVQLVLQKAPDTKIWQAIFELIATVTRADRSTPAPASSLAEPQTPRSRNTSSLPNSSERRTDIDALLKGELSVYFDDIDGLGVAAAAVLESCKTSHSPLFSDEGGWKDWPDTADEKSVLNWLTGIIDRFILFAKDHNPDVTLVRRPLAQPAKPIDGSIARRKLDIGFVEDVDSTPDKRYEWSEILVPGELKNDRFYDIPSGARLDLARYVREIFSAQDERRFVIGFTLCGPLLRVWEFDLCHGDAGVSPWNLLVNEDADNPSWPAFLIDLDLAIRADRNEPSGARGKTGTLAFMAIGVLYGERHSYMHDLESFFWVLFWICIHYESPEKERVVERFEEWNYMGTEKLADAKKGIVSDESDFLKVVADNFTSYYQPLVPWVNRLRRIVFPDDKRWKEENPGLAEDMRKMFQKAQKDTNVIN
ncbi:hypothetical protein LOZ58_006852 [Ophidiomyces ophidiicola]|nr:hypothetical protein LOZ58_006852 [Ophidiomyces ophidiicola]